MYWIEQYKKWKLSHALGNNASRAKSREDVQNPVLVKNWTLYEGVNAWKDDPKIVMIGVTEKPNDDEQVNF